MNVLDVAGCVRRYVFQINQAGVDKKNLILKNEATLLLNRESEILAANFKDIQNAKNNGMPANFVDRLTLNSERISAMVDSVNELISMSALDGEIEGTLIDVGGFLER